MNLGTYMSLQKDGSHFGADGCVRREGIFCSASSRYKRYLRLDHQRSK